MYYFNWSFSSSEELSIYLIMKQIKFVIPFLCFIFMGMLSTAQTTQKTVAKETVKTEATSTTKTCQPSDCKPSYCAKLVKTGACTPEQMLECLKNGKKCLKSDTAEAGAAVKVASVSKERSTLNTSKSNKKKSCTKTCSAKKSGE